MAFQKLLGEEPVVPVGVFFTHAVSAVAQEAIIRAVLPFCSVHGFIRNGCWVSVVVGGEQEVEVLVGPEL